MTATRTDMLTVRALLDEALLGLRAVGDPAVPVRDAERALADALEHAYRALACRGDVQVFNTEAASSLERTRGALVALQAMDTQDPGALAALTLVAHSLRALAGVGYTVLDAPPTLPVATEMRPVLRASVGVPQLLDVPRDVLRPVIPLPALPEAPPPAPAEPLPPAPVTSLAQLDALLATARAEAESLERDDDTPPALPPANDDEARVAVDDDVILFDRARTCMEDLAVLGAMRAPLESEAQSWSGRARTEQRLLARIDAIVACGPGVLPRLARLAETRPVPDPELTWAALFLFGSLAGDDALDQVTRLVRASPLDDLAMRERVTDALSLLPHFGVESVLRAWLHDPLPARRVVAVTALGRRRALFTEEGVSAASDPDLDVVRAAATALSRSNGNVHPVVFDELCRHADETVVRAAMASATVRGSEAGVRRALALLHEGRAEYADAALVVALGAHEDEGTAALRAAAGTEGATPALLEAVGWFGALDWVDYLLAQLAGDNPALCGAAVIALQRLTGASLTDARPAPHYDEHDRPFARAYAAPEDPGELSEDPDVWRAWWRAHGSLAKPRVRYRWGHVWSARDDADELARPLATGRARRAAHLELVARTGGTLPFDPDDFVARQHSQIEQWRGFVDARRERAPAGSWSTRLER